MKNTLYNGNYFLTEVTAPKEKERITNCRYDENYSNLWNCYGRYSHAKEKAFDYCRQLCYVFGGYNMRIVSHNTFTFCVKFDFVHPETGVLCTAYITPAYNRYAEQ